MKITFKFLLWMNMHSPSRYTFVLFEPYCDWIPRAHTLSGYLAIGVRFYPHVRVDCPPTACWDYVLANVTPAIEYSKGFTCKTYPAFGSFACVLEENGFEIDRTYALTYGDAQDWFQEIIEELYETSLAYRS